jgi:hypothetical protein
MSDSLDRVAIEPDDPVFTEEPAVAVFDPIHFPPQPIGRMDHGTDNGVQAGCVPSAGIYGDASNLIGHKGSRRVR